MEGTAGRDDEYQRLHAEGEPSLSVRRRLALRSGNTCAFPGCDSRLEQAAPIPGHGTVLGIECHIVAKKDVETVARAPVLLSAEEIERWADLIENRHGFSNLVLMCREHATLIDAVVQGFSVADVVSMKAAHEEDADARRLALAETAGGLGQCQGPLAAQQVRPVVLDDVGHWQRKAILALAADPDSLAWLKSEIGDEATPEAIRDLIGRWPRQLIEGPAGLLEALIREAEALGLWPEASIAWERYADRAEEDDKRADRLVRGAIDSGMAADGERRDRLLREAEQRDPGSTRLKLERFDDARPPSEQLEVLAGLETDDPALLALIAAQRSMAYLLLPDLEGAERAVEEALRFEEDSVAAQAAQINLGVQRARLALIGDRAFAMADVLKTRDDALDLRRRLLEMGRWEESSRLLMLAAEVMGLLRDPDAAREILERASVDELTEAPLGAEVLGDAALRADSPDLSLRFTEGAESTAAIARIRATAEVDFPGNQRDDALLRLEGLARGGGQEGEYAAASRLLACLPPVSAEWNEEMAAMLAGGPNQPMASRLRIIALLESDPSGAKVLARELPEESWAAELRLRVAGAAGDDEMIKAAAEEFLGHGPDPSGLLLIAKALAGGGELDRAGEILTGMVHDPNCPPRIRNDAFDALMSTLADRGHWRIARRIWTEWADFAFKELRRPVGRVSAWQVRVAHNDRPQRPNGSPG